VSQEPVLKTRTQRTGPLRHRLLATTLLLVTAGMASGCRADEPSPTGPAATIRGQRVELEVTRTRAEMARGLGYRDSLAAGHGMLFRYDLPDFHGFWMKGMRFDIDIVWIRGGRIVDISHQVPHVPGSNGPTVRPREAADTVLEVPSGYAAIHGWRVGDRVEFSDLDPEPVVPR
jgi:uncharacterized membrane protein (UPF0127 family)